MKRLRNTAASARFRAKKKQREQTLEQQAREKKQALEKLESRIRELEQENRFLKGLIMGPKEEELKVNLLPCLLDSALALAEVDEIMWGNEEIVSLTDDCDRH